MYCPKCGQPQVSDEIRFCVRCGLQLDSVKNLVSTGGQPIQQIVAYQPVVKQYKPGFKTAVKIIFLSIILAPIFFVLSIMVDNPAPLVFPLMIFLLGGFWLFYSHFFGESPIQLNTQQQTINEANMTKQLVSQYEQPNALPPQSINTAEMVKPPSVTEHTTKLLEQK